ncbi:MULTISPECIES: hypothetical protein [unclassified Treponema]|uniref:hypothetical protein n=1 Tax=unclassified Treponema TaxID=2638727 RepID=UPI0020A42156|nr:MULTISPECIES: hypothetical protein [unclassified Treponema]UTC66380.1 hypothetical protein E4O06_10440 [Treponema sp. OMZ 789]UTC69110.1 hypothetical protein E4O01_10585 [Treponema sp. OMZ 790]UTC71822.1 hypothetical protein E4O02_10675 [Treponema sp. OMZ 791]
MRTGLKVLISLVISLAVFSGLLFLTASGYESFTETKIYKPSIVRYINENLSEIERTFKIWNETNTEMFKNFLHEEALMSTVKQEQSKTDIEERNNLISKIMSTVPGFAGLRIIDSEYQKIHFSTFPEDILTKTDSMLSYKKYNDSGALIPYQHIEVPDNLKIKITASTELDLLLYCLPFYDSYDVYRGTAVFYISGNSFLYHLVSENILSISDELALLSDQTHSMLGILTGTHNVVSPDLKEMVLNDWERLPQNLRVISLEGKDSWVLITKKSDFGYIGRITEKKVFTFPITVKYFLIFTVFVTIFLTFFLLLNIKRNRLFVAQNKIQQLHLSILKNYLKSSQRENWAELQKELEYHRHEVNAEIKKGLGKKLLQTKGKEIDDFLQKSWQEIFDIINKTAAGKKLEQGLKDIEAEDLINLLMEALKNQKNASEKPESISASPESAEPLSEVEELDTDVEELDEIEEIAEAEELDEVEEAETVEALEETEEIAEAEELDEVEEAETVEALEETEEIAEAEELDEVEEAETVEALEETEEIAEAEELDEVEEAETVEALGKIEEPGSIDYLDDLEEISEDEDNDDPMLRLNDFGYTISGLDFSELDVPISELEGIEAKKVEYIDDNYSPIRSMWGKYDIGPTLGDLDVVGDCEPIPLLELSEEQTIVNEDGVFIIRKTEPVKPENEDFKALVDSVLR